MVEPSISKSGVINLFDGFCCDFLPSTPSFVTSMLFAVHPIHTEAVTGVVGRAELLSSIFFLLALQTYIRSTRQKGPNDYKTLLRCIMFAGLAMLSKEQGITVVAVCVTYDIFLVQKGSRAPLVPDRAPRGKIKGPTPTWRKDLVLRLLVMTIGTALLLAARMKLMGTKLPVFNKFDNPASVESWPIRHLTHHYLVSFNAWLLFFPSDLCCDWTMGTIPLVTSFFDLRVLPTVLFYAVICIFVWKIFKSEITISKRIIMGVSLCVFPFIPASNLLYPVGFVVAERVLYIPSMGFCFLVAHGWHLLCQRERKDEETLFQSGLRITKENAKLYNNLGHVMEARGKYEDALQLFLKAANVQPDDLGSHLNVGRMYNLLGRTEEAEKAFWMAKNLLPKVRPGKTYQTHIVPRHLDLFLNLGNLLSKNHSRLEEAQQLYKEAISMKTDYIDGYMQRASLLLKLNRTEEAHDMYKQALKYDHMNPDIFYNIVKLRDITMIINQNSHDSLTEIHFRKFQNIHEHDRCACLELDLYQTPSWTSFYKRKDNGHLYVQKSLLNYAILTQDSGDSSLRRLAHERLQVLLNKGRQPERTYFNMGMLAMQDRDTASAENYFRKALQLRGDFDAALFNLALVLHETRRPLEAVPYLQRLKNRHLKGLVLLGNIYFNDLKNYTAAQQCYELILKKDQNHIPALHNLCASLFQLDQLEAAETCLLHAKKLAPQERYIEHHLNIVQQRRKKLASSPFKNTAPETAFCTDSKSNCNEPIETGKTENPKLSFFLEKR
ncbi:Protein O-mannosyl-transferase TMTC3 like protein [Argiope bruennichi]|uniref:dolichyl-phosphate-mannose--protein mannosyltransferase n=1 Tax=Argiope bruennichi TaxID=94029 RepID=A0A8T0G1Z9_ARGBR|nr:Protein O-mannosyl-transferase TMTC3 like protein [Argiope bruennichi]